MTQIGDIITVSYEESRLLRRQGWKVRTDIVTLMYVGKPPKSVKSNVAIAGEIASSKTRGKRWDKADHDFVARKLAEADA
jgi:hypothetical protein